MIGRIRGISENVALYSLFGYFLSTTFSHALAQMFFALALLFAIILFIGEENRRDRIHFSYFTIFIVLFVGWSVLSALFNPTPGKSLFILKEEWLFLMIPVAAYLSRNEKAINIAMKVFALSAIVLSLYAIWQHFSGLDPYHGTQLPTAPSSGYRVVGTFSNRLTFGNYYAIASVLFLAIASYADRWSSKSLFYLAFSLTAVASIFTYNRGSLLAFLVGIVIFLIWVGRRYLKATLALLAALVVVIVIAAPDLPSRYLTTFETEWEGKYAGSRLSIWRTGWRMASHNPVFGVGAGNFSGEYCNYRDDESDRIYSHAHNDILNIAAYAGIPAAFFYLGFWALVTVRIVRTLRNLKDNACVKGVVLGILLATVVFFLTSLYEATFADEEIRLLLMALWGLFFGAERLIKKQVEKAET